MLPLPQSDRACLRLMPRELQIAHIRASGATLQECADKMHITLYSAKTYLREVYSKLDCHSVGELTGCLETYNKRLQP